ncbi:hypothetical protein VAR608DRAFT_2277 [Variovorax sp. HW608]|nr:hypothetical protein VAR608DRAFT_2277 [Variovorax sp. HW608]
MKPMHMRVFIFRLLGSDKAATLGGRGGNPHQPH